MSGTGDGPRPWIAVIGDRAGDVIPQEAIEPSVADAASSLGWDPPDLRWVATDRLGADGSVLLEGAAGVWCAPGSPYRSLGGALEGIRWARESGVPFLGTCAGFQHAVIEFARDVLGHARAGHAEYAGLDAEGAEGEPGRVELFIDELLCSLVGQSMQVEVVDGEVLAMYGTASPVERYYCRFGLVPSWAQQLDAAGLRIAGVDAADGDTRIMRAADHPFFLLTLFVPQTSSTPDRPHPLVVAFLRAVRGV